METLSHALGWANYLLTWTWLLWFGIGTVVGGIMLARDEWRLHRTRPKPEEVHAHAKNLVARYGREAFRINGDAMVAARNAKQFDRYRFLKEVAGELAARSAAEPRTSLDPIEEWWRPGAVQEPPSH